MKKRTKPAPSVPWYKVAKFTVIGWWWRFERWYDARFGMPTVEESIVEMRREADLEARRARAVVERHRFLEHVAVWKLQALKAWEDEHPPF